MLHLSSLSFWKVFGNALSIILEHILRKKKNTAFHFPAYTTQNNQLVVFTIILLLLVSVTQFYLQCYLIYLDYLCLYNLYFFILTKKLDMIFQFIRVPSIRVMTPISVLHTLSLTPFQASLTDDYYSLIHFYIALFICITLYL